MKQIKEEKLLFFRILPIAVGMLLINIISFISKYGRGNRLTGYSIKSTVSGIYTIMPVASKFFLVFQWVGLISLLVYLFFRDKNILNTKREVKSLNLETTSKKVKTDLDALYNILQEKGKIRISTIARAFKIDKELATEWAKTLEEGKLAIIDYPSFGSSVLKLKKRKRRGKSIF